MRLEMMIWEGKMYKKILMSIFMGMLLMSGASGKLFFDYGFESGKRDWTTREENNKNMTFVGVPAKVKYISPGREGKSAIQFLTTTNERSELVTNGSVGKYQFGKEYWTGISFKIVEDFSDKGFGGVFKKLCVI
jgi:hypothetical protein